MNFVRLHIAPFKADQVLYRFRYSIFDKTTMSINMPTGNRVTHAIDALLHSTLGCTPHHEKPHEPYGNQITSEARSVAYDGNDSVVRDWYNRTWELDSRCAEAIVNSDLWKLDHPLGKDRQVWENAFSSIIPNNHFTDWQPVEPAKNCEEYAVCKLRTHYLCNMLCSTVDWSVLCTCPAMQPLVDGLNHAEDRILEKHVQCQKGFAEAFQESLQEWIAMLP